MRRRFYIGVAAIGLLVAGCAELPGLDEATGGIPVSEIVIRIKCELSDAFTEPQDIDQSDMMWLKDWTAQMDLTLEILDSATLAPGGSLMQPFHNAYGTGAGPSSISTSGVPGTTLAAIPQSFALAAGVNLNGQASRTETLEFVFSLQELKRWRAATETAQQCAISDHMDLRGRLGLKEWVTQALDPVRGHLLYAGYHPKPQSTPPGSSAKSTAPEPPKPAITPSPTQVENETKECTDGELADIKSAEKNLKAALSDVQDPRLKNVPERITAATKSLTTSLASASADFSKAAQALRDKTVSNADFEKYKPVLEPYVLKRINTASDFLKKITAKEPEFEQETPINIDFANEKAADAGKLISPETPLPSLETQIEDLIKLLPTPEEIAKKQCRPIDYAKKATEAVSFAASASQALGYAKDADIDVVKASCNIKSIQTFTTVTNSYANSLQTIDPPLSTIGQSVQFILEYGGNITPTWTFVNFKGANNPLFSSSGTRTHMLNITIGSPTALASSANSALAQNQLYLLLNNRLPLR